MYRLQSRPVWQRAANGPLFAIDFIQNPAIPPGWMFSRATSATWFDTQCVMKTAGSDMPRFDHDPATGAALGLRLESARQNLLLNSDAPERWTPYGIRVTTDGLLAPDGKTPARRIIEDASNGVHAVSQSYSVTSTATVWSLWVRLKPAERTIAQVMLTDSGTVDYCFSNFNLRACTVGTQYKGTGAWTLKDASCVPLANGWAECRISGLVASATAVRASIYLMQSDQLNHSYAGDNASGFYHGGAQLEIGTSTSYIQTTTASVSRYSDFLTTSDLKFLDANEGTFVFDGSLNGVSGGGMFAFSLDDAVNNGIGIYKISGSGTLAAYSGSSGSTGLGVTVTDGQRFRAGVAWSRAGATASASANGRSAIAVAGAQPVVPELLSIGSARNRQFASNVLARSFTYWPRRLSDAELATVTVI